MAVTTNLLTVEPVCRSLAGEFARNCITGSLFELPPVTSIHAKIQKSLVRLGELFGSLNGPPAQVVNEWVGPGFFSVAGMQILAGHDFAWSDAGHHPIEKVIRAQGHHYSLRTMTVDERLDSYINIQRLTALLSEFLAEWRC